MRIDRAIGAVLRPVVFLGMAALTAVITLQIVSRVFFTSVEWTEEVARFLLVWITFIGATLAFHEGRHIAVDILPRRLSPGPRRALMVVQHAVAIAFFASLAVISWRYTQLQGFQRSPSLQVSMSYVYVVIPTCTVVITLISLSDLVRALRGDLSKPATEEAAQSKAGL